MNLKYRLNPPSHADLTRLKVGTLLVMKDIYLRWNELIGSRWYVAKIFVGRTRRTKMMPEEKYEDATKTIVYALRPRDPRHSHYPPGRTAEWEVTEKVLFNYFEISTITQNTMEGPFI